MPRKERQVWVFSGGTFIYYYYFHEISTVKLSWGQDHCATVPKTVKHNPASNSSQPKWRKAKCPSKGHTAAEPQPEQALASLSCSKATRTWPSLSFLPAASLCSLLPIWAKLLLSATPVLVEEGELSAQLEKQRFAYTPVWCSAEGIKYHRNCWSVDFWFMPLFSLWTEIILQYVYKKGRRQKITVLTQKTSSHSLQGVIKTPTGLMFLGSTIHYSGCRQYNSSKIVYLQALEVVVVVAPWSPGIYKQWEKTELMVAFVHLNAMPSLLSCAYLKKVALVSFPHIQSHH